MILLALLLASASPADTPTPRITVTGTGSAETPPDTATIGYTLRGEGPTSDAAVSALVDHRKTTEQAIASLIPAYELTGSRVSIEQARGKDCESDGDAQLSKGPCAVLGYVAEMAMTLRTHAIKDAGTIVGAIGRTNGTNPSLRSFALTDPKPAQRRAIAVAIANARSLADAIAAGTGAHVGPIISATYGRENDRGGDEIIVTGRRVASPVLAPPPIQVTITPEPVTTTATVVVTYAIAP